MGASPENPFPNFPRKDGEPAIADLTPCLSAESVKNTFFLKSLAS